MRRKVGARYYPNRRQAEEAAAALPERWRHSHRVRLFERGWAIQLHDSGPYVGGTDCEPQTHVCRWCPR